VPWGSHLVTSNAKPRAYCRSQDRPEADRKFGASCIAVIVRRDGGVDEAVVNMLRAAAFREETPRGILNRITEGRATKVRISRPRWSSGTIGANGLHHGAAHADRRGGR
jgi:hypothetical protein